MTVDDSIHVEIINDLHGLVPGKYRGNNFAGGSIYSDAVQGPPDSEPWFKTHDSGDQGCPIGPKTDQKQDLHHCLALTRHEAIKIIFRTNVKFTSKTDRQLRLKIRVEGSEWNR